MDNIYKDSIKSDMDELKKLEKERDILNIKIKCLKMKLGLEYNNFNHTPKLQKIIAYWIGGCKERKK